MKTFGFKIDPLTGEDYYEVYVRGRQLMSDSLLNKASAFKKDERLSLGLDGMLRSGVSKLDFASGQAYEVYQRNPKIWSATSTWQGVRIATDTFYRLFIEHLERWCPIVYTPSRWAGCMK